MALGVGLRVRVRVRVTCCHASSGVMVFSSASRNLSHESPLWKMGSPPTLTGELVKLDKGPAIETLLRKHHLRPFQLDVYNVEYNFD